MTDSPLVQALKNRKKATAPASESEQLLEMILMQVTKMADHLAEKSGEEKKAIVTTQESHTP